MHTGVAVWSLTEPVAIDPDLAVHVDAVELDEDFFPADACGRFEDFPIPADAAWQITTLCFADVICIKRPLDTPVVRQVEFSPCRVIVVHCLSAFCVVFKKQPISIETLAHAWWGASGFCGYMRTDGAENE